MIGIATAVEDHLLNSGGLRSLGNRATYSLCLLMDFQLADILAQLCVQGRGRNQRAARLIIYYLCINMLQTAKDTQARSFCCAYNLAAHTRMAATARFKAKGRRIDFALPVLWEWQRAARAGNLDNLWPWGREKLFFACNSRAFWGRDNRGSLLPVAWWYGEPPGTGGATSEGLFGMAGNAREMALLPYAGAGR